MGNYQVDAFLGIIILVLGFHFVADFLCQSSHMANNKHNNIAILSYHILVYTSVLWLLSVISLQILTKNFIDVNNLGYYNHINSVTIFAVSNGILHFLTDFITSKITHKFFNSNRIREGFIIVGLDQMLHTISLVTTAYYIFS